MEQRVLSEYPWVDAESVWQRVESIKKYDGGVVREPSLRARVYALELQNGF